MSSSLAKAMKLILMALAPLSQSFFTDEEIHEMSGANLIFPEPIPNKADHELTHYVNEVTLKEIDF
jgi:hypothetical protein